MNSPHGSGVAWMKLKRKELESRLGLFAFTRAQRYLGKRGVERVERIGERMGRLLFRLAAKRRKRAESNLALAFPELSSDQRQRLALANFEHFGRVTADFLASRRRTREELLASIEAEGREHFDAALQEGRGALLLTAHLGNWERLAAWITANGYTLNVVARDANQTGVNQLVNELRENSGSKVIPRGNPRPILERLKANEVVGILPDQNSDQVYLPFFGHPAGTVLGPGALHERTQAPILLAWCLRTGPGKYRVVVEPPIRMYEESKNQGLERGEAVMRMYLAHLEDVIRAYPDQWLWFHDRWRSARRKGLLPAGL